MTLLLRCAFITAFVLPAWASAGPAKTVLGAAGRRVRLPCLTPTAAVAAARRQADVDICWGRGEASVFSCHNAVIHAVGNRVKYKESQRFFLHNFSSSLIIFGARMSDTGLYHCRVQLPGLFNDQTASVRLIVTDRTIIRPPAVSATTESSLLTEHTHLNAPHTASEHGFTSQSSDAASGNSTRPVVPRVQSAIKQQRADSLLGFIGNTMRTSFIIFIPALLLTAAYRFCRTNKRVKIDGGLNQTQEKENSL